MPGPFRPDEMLFVRTITPGKKIADIKIRLNPIIVK